MLFLTEKRRRKRSNNHRERNKQKRILHPTAPLRAPTKWQSLQADEQLRSAQVAGQWRGDTALTLPLFWRRSTVSPVFFGRFPRSSQSPCPLPTLSPSLIGHPASVDVKQHKSQKLMKGGGDSSVVRAPDSWLKGRGFESLLERRENFLLQGRLSVLTLISVSVPPPCYHSST